MEFPYSMPYGHISGVSLATFLPVVLMLPILKAYNVIDSVITSTKEVQYVFG